MPVHKNPLAIATLGGIAVGSAIALHLMVSEDDGLPPLPMDSTEQPGSDQDTNQQDTMSVPEETASINDAAMPESTESVQKTEAALIPDFDVVRVTREGSAVIAGRAPAGQVVEVFDGEKSLGVVKADENGEWVFVPGEPLAPGNRELSLKTVGADGTSVQSEQVVMIVVPEPESDGDILVVATVRDGSEASEVLQKPSSESRLVLAIEAVDYDDQGELRMSGIAAPNALVNVYLDNTYIGTTQADSDGAWSLIPETRIQTGLYELRADQVDDKGTVHERVSMPFMRDEPDLTIDPGTSYVVQPGNSLWRIARRTYGEGVEFTIIYKANIEQIGDPDLIYPGQIFSLPSVN